jgi:ketose-bisphosphate aldolase
MPLVSMQEIVQDAWRKRYAVGYFECWNLESALAVVDAAERMRSPVIIGFSGRFLASEGRVVRESIAVYGALGRAVACEARVPVGLLLNECEDVSTVLQGVKAGFNGVMYSKEGLSPEEEIAVLRYITGVARHFGVYVEGEVGRLPTAERGRGIVQPGKLSDPGEAARFVQETGVDALSVSVGNVHILEEGKAHLDHELIASLAGAAGVPLVLHGGTGIDEEDIKKAVELGVSKVNVGTALKRAFLRSLADSFRSADIERDDAHDLLGRGGEKDVLARARVRLAWEVARFIEIFGSAGRAR